MQFLDGGIAINADMQKKTANTHTTVSVFHFFLFSVAVARSRAFWLCLWSGKKHTVAKTKG